MQKLSMSFSSNGISSSLENKVVGKALISKPIACVKSTKCKSSAKYCIVGIPFDNDRTVKNVHIHVTKKKKNDKEYCSAQGWSLEIILGLARNIK